MKPANADSLYIAFPSGNKVFYADPKGFFIEDVANGISRTYRFQSQIEWTVCQHTLVLVQLLRTATDQVSTLYGGLMHDTPEYLTGDIPRPLLRFIPEFQTFKDLVEIRMEEVFMYSMDALVKRFDDIMLLVEAEYFNVPLDLRHLDHDTLTPEIKFAAVQLVKLHQGMTHEQQRQAFLEAYHHYISIPNVVSDLQQKSPTWPWGHMSMNDHLG